MTPRTITVAAAIIRRDGYILLVQRPDDAEMGGLWEFPGGKIEPGETPEAALARELGEELGIQVAVGRRYHITDHAYPTGLNVRLLFYECRIVEGEPRLLWGQALRWVAASDLPAYPAPAADAEVVRSLRIDAAHDL